MGENIEVKDVQKTEYLDKNGLDMLWAKVKENTRNQVEVERNRAITQETRIIETKADKSELNSYVSDTALKALEQKITANTANINNKQDAGNYLHYETLNNKGYYEIPSVCIPGSDGSTKTDIDSQNISVNRNDGTTASIASDEIRVSNEALGYMIITCDKVRHYYDDEGSLGFDLNSDGIKLQGGDDNHVLTSNGSTIDIRDYAKKTDIPEVDTSDFVSKSDTITQTINSGLIAMDKLQVFSKGYYDQVASLRGGIYTEGNDTKFTLNDTTASHNYMVLTASKLFMKQGVGDNTLLITTSGIANTDNSANHVYATDGSVADLTQYVKKSDITTGGNVDDVQVNGVSVVENKIANINSATKESLGVVKVGDGLNVTDGTISVDTTAIGSGNYIPYKNIAFKNKYVIEPSYSIEFRTDALNNKYGKAFIGPQTISITSASGQHAAVEPEEISVRQSGNVSGTIHSTLNADSFGVYSNSDDSVIFKLNQYGIKLEDGDNNHVLTSNASTIDITQYVLKSVYDKKIAALEARIAALEAKHTEAAQ